MLWDQNSMSQSGFHWDSKCLETGFTGFPNGKVPFFPGMSLEPSGFSPWTTDTSGRFMHLKTWKVRLNREATEYSGRSNLMQMLLVIFERFPYNRVHCFVTSEKKKTCFDTLFGVRNLFVSGLEIGISPKKPSKTTPKDGEISAKTSFSRCFPQDWVERSTSSLKKTPWILMCLFFFKVKAERSSGDFWEMWGMTFQQILKDADFLLIVAWWLMVEGWCSI